jgi:hypothetical protein
VVAFVDGRRRSVPELRAGDEVYRPWEEAMEREVTAGTEGEPLCLGRLAERPHTVTLDVPAGHEEEPVTAPSGEPVGAVVRAWGDLQGRLEVRAEAVDRNLFRLTATIANETPWEGANAPRGDVVRRAFMSTHTILRVRGGEFVSLLEPPQIYEAAARSCANTGTWPVLVGEPGERHTMLSSPIILYDYPQVAPESPVSFFDTTEIDELLALSVMTLSDAEKAEMRETDPRAREILQKTESLTPEELMSLHGSIRSMQTLRRDER